MRENRKQRVVFGLNSLGVGGVERQFTELVHHFDKKKFEVILITLFRSNKKDLYDELPHDLEVHKLNFKSSRDFNNLWKLYKVLKRVQPDVVVSSLFFSNTIFRLLKPFVGYDSIAREHNTYVNKPRWQQYIDRVLSHLSYRIVAVSKTVAEFTSKQEKIPLEKFEVIHNGVDVEKVRERLEKLPPKDEMKKKLGFDPKDKFFINVARLASQKNHALLIKSFKEFRETHPEYKLIILGDGGLKDELQKQVEELGQEGNIFLLGTKMNVFDYYYISDIFVLTSQIEGFATVSIEAMSCGIPVVSTRTAGPNEYIIEGENGFLIDDSSVGSVVHELEKVIKSDYQQLSSGALETSKHFDIKHIAQKYNKLFSQAMNYKME